MRRFQTWSQNSNGIAFDLLFAKKVENWHNGLFYQFPTVLSQKGVKFFDFNFETRSGILSSRRIL